MTELYRGILEILVNRCIEQIESLRIHIRSFNTGKSTNQDFDIGVSGFWNLVLETIFTMLTIIFVFLSVCLTAMLAIVSYPPAAFINYGAWLLRSTRNPPIEEPVIIKQKHD